MEIKTGQMSINIFSNQNLLDSDCLFWLIQVWMSMLKGIKIGGVIYQKGLRIITSSSTKRTDSDIN